MSCKPLIGINADYRSANRQTPAYGYVSAGYFESIKAAGGVPVIIPPLDDVDSVRALLDVLDGVVLIGGADLDHSALVKALETMAASKVAPD